MQCMEIGFGNKCRPVVDELRFVKGGFVLGVSQFCFVVDIAKFCNKNCGDTSVKNSRLFLGCVCGFTNKCCESDDDDINIILRKVQVEEARTFCSMDLIFQGRLFVKVFAHLSPK